MVNAAKYVLRHVKAAMCSQASGVVPGGAVGAPPPTNPGEQINQPINRCAPPSSHPSIPNPSLPIHISTPPHSHNVPISDSRPSLTAMRLCLLFLPVLSILALADSDLISANRIKVQLFASPSFFSEVSIDAYDNTCVSLDNNLIDGRVQSILVGGHDVGSVLARDDYWRCAFFDNYDCGGDDDQYITILDGVNNLASVGWGTRIHGLRCHNSDPDREH